ncbi:hypothetical protein RY966_003747 [Enterobacter kobei]|nr:hypothetical protein [Enterobacter kobei]
MENYYEYLGIDMTATDDEISSVIEAKASEENADQAKLREVKSILLIATAKTIYDEKLINFILNKGTSGQSVDLDLDRIRDFFSIDNAELHNKYIWIVMALFIVSIFSGFMFSFIVSATINFMTMIAQLILFYMDWKMLERHGKANFSKWWMLFSPGYMFKRSKALGPDRKLFYAWMAVILIYGVGTVIFNGSTALLESSACGVVTDIYHNQLHQYSMTCKKVTITDSAGKDHYGLAEMNDGSTRDVYIGEKSNGQIYVKVDQQ